jgi:hypothetical protein
VKTNQIDHVGGEKRDAVLLEELLVLVKHAIEPRQKLFRAMVGVDYTDVSSPSRIYSTMHIRTTGMP